MAEWGTIIIRSLGAMLILFAMTRILGKKQISQLSFFEYITGIAIGDLAGFISTDIEKHFAHGALVMLVWFMVPLAAEKLTMKSRRIRGWLEGKGTVVIEEGRVLEANLRKERYTADELLSRLRVKGVFNPADVEFAMLEPSGALSVLLKTKHQPLTPVDVGMEKQDRKPPQAVIMDGEVLQEGLVYLGLDIAWLKRELDKLGYDRKDIFLAVADERGGLYVDYYKRRRSLRLKRHFRVGKRS